MARSPDLDESASRAIEIFERGARQRYGARLLKIVLFGSRARGDADANSDLDVVVVLDDIKDRVADRNLASDIAYDAIVDTYVDVHAIPISQEEWEDPEQHKNPDFVLAIRRDGIAIESETTKASPQV